MNLLNKNIVIANVITRSAQSFTLAEKRIIFAGIAQLSGKNNEVVLTAHEYAEVFGLSLENSYQQLKGSVENLRKRYVTWQISDGKKIGKRVANWLQGYDYFDKEGHVKFKFTEYVFPFLFELEKEFTKYKLKQTCALRSIHSWRLLELFEQQRQSYKTGKINEKGNIALAKNKNGWLKISLDEFHHAMETPESYKLNFKDLRARIIEPAVKELTNKDHWIIDWKTIKKGRKVVMLEFNFNRNPQQDLFN